MLLGHHFRNGQLEPRFEPQIAFVMMPTGDPLIYYGDAADVVALHHVERFAHRPILTNGYRIDDHAGLRTLYLIDFLGLTFNAQIFMDTPIPPCWAIAIARDASVTVSIAAEQRESANECRG